ncbi:MAG: hypothetical protein HON53_04010 [Planctomycetaceae bacterium]|nr:hypothetical protein [Planctomycetaceae bacterium]MBT6153709.1 hypothetical protein [Planctomycetaceae bacterium]MBT6484955.1 hypothetical protein [Planctomycetaceae bacterium]MBT6493214.1 hypothetical protein [Planctomycetaceae bacterium]
MPNIKDQMTDTESARPGVGGELRQLKTNGAASAGELREFIGSLKGKSPQEVLGAVAQSGLTRGIVQATIGFVVVLVTFSVVPYGYNKIWPATDGTTAAKTTEEEQSADPNTDESVSSEQPVAAADDVPAGAGDVTDALGIGETKTSDPNANPLESKSNLDNLLDGVD